MRLGDTHILIRITTSASYHVAVTYGTLNGAEVEINTWEHIYRFDKRLDDPKAELARLLGLVSHDIPQ